MQKVENREDFIRLRQILAEQLVTPADCFLPLSTLKTVRKDDHWVITLHSSLQCTNLQSLVEDKVELRLDELLSLLKQFIERTTEVQAVLGPVKFTAESVFICGGTLKLSPLLSKAPQSEGVSTVLETFGKVCLKRGADISKLLHDLSDVSDSPRLLSITTASCLSELNCALRKQPFDEAAVHTLLDAVTPYRLLVTLCMNNLCPGAAHGQVTVCSMHCFCSQKCLKALQQEHTASCPLCPDAHFREERKGDICTCGKALEGDEHAWRLNYLGSEEYGDSMKYCSDACFNLHTLSPQSESLDEMECVHCGMSRSSQDGDSKYSFNCNRHFFCTRSCFKEFFSSKVPEFSSLWPNCFICSRDICEVKAAEKQRLEELAPLIDRIEDLKDVFLRLQNATACKKLKDALDKFAVLLRFNISLTSPRDFSLSFQDLGREVYFLLCCGCKKEIDVHVRKLSEMQTWDDSPFLLQCEIHVHGVCSLYCALNLRRTTSQCPVCPGFALDFSVLDVDRRERHPSLEVLRKVPKSVCYCKKSESFFLLPKCAHEYCRECLGSYLTDTHSGAYYCHMCLEPYSSSKLLSQLFI